MMNDRSNEIVRVEQIRKITYQGPRSWVNGTLRRSMKGTVQVDAERTIKSEEISRQELPAEMLQPDMTLAEHKERNARLNQKRQQREITIHE